MSWQKCIFTLTNATLVSLNNMATLVCARCHSLLAADYNSDNQQFSSVSAALQPAARFNQPNNSDVSAA